MKKFLSVLAIIASAISVYAFDDYDITVKKNDTYMMFIDEKPVQIHVADPKILKAQYSSDLFNQCYQITFRTYCTGKTKMLITTANGKQYTLNVKVEINPIVSGEVITIDSPPECE